MYIEWDAKKLRAQVEYNAEDMLMFIRSKSFLNISIRAGSRLVFIGRLSAELKKHWIKPIVEVQLVRHEYINPFNERREVVARLGRLHFRSRAEVEVFLGWYEDNKEEFWRQFIMGFAKELEEVCEALKALKKFEINITL